MKNKKNLPKNAKKMRKTGEMEFTGFHAIYSKIVTVLPNFPNLRSKSHDYDVFGTYWENIDFWFRLLIPFLREIRPSDCDLKYHFGPKVLEYGRKKLYLVRFPQLAFVMTSPLL